MFNIVDTPNFAAVFGGGEFILAALAALLVLAAIFAVLALAVPRLIRVIRPKLAVISLAIPLVMSAPQAAANDELRIQMAAMLGVAGIVVLVLTLQDVVTSAPVAGSTRLHADNGDDSNGAISLGSFRLSEHGASAHDGVNVAIHSSMSARGGIFPQARRDSGGGLFGEVSRLSAGALAKVNASSWAQSGWSIRPSMALTDSQNADDARFLLRMERTF